MISMTVHRRKVGGFLLGRSAMEGLPGGLLKREEALVWLEARLYQNRKVTKSTVIVTKN